MLNYSLSCTFVAAVKNVAHFDL